MDKTTYSFKEREITDFTVNNNMAKKIAETLNRIKGRQDLIIAESGNNLDIDGYINYKISKATKTTPDLKIFQDEIESRGLSVYMLIDVSYSMKFGGINENLKNIVATIYKALDQCSFIDFHVTTFSGKNREPHARLQEIESISDCKYITVDLKDTNAPTYIALNYITEKIKKMEDNKKLVILFTDGIPIDGKHNSRDTLKLMKQATVNMKNQKINFFTIFYNNTEYYNLRHDYDNNKIIDNMREIYKNGLYETKNFDQVEKVMIKKLSESVERINQS